GHYVANGDFFALDGIWRIRVIVRRKGVEDVAVEFPIYVPPQNVSTAADPQARALLVTSEKAMNAVTSLRARQELNDGANGVVVTNYDYRAPDRLRFNFEGQGASIAVGALQYYQDKSGQWTRRARVAPFVFPQFDFAEQAQAVKMWRAESVNGA